MITRIVVWQVVAVAISMHVLTNADEPKSIQRRSSSIVYASVSPMMIEARISQRDLQIGGLGNEVIHRINCGSNDTFTTQLGGIVWSPDQYFKASRISSSCATTPGLYCSERYFRSTNPSPHRYDIPVPYNNANYQVKLHFTETRHVAARKRVFDVLLEGRLAIDNLDIYSEAKGINVPYVVTSNTVVKDNMITIEFVSVVQFPSINAIEVTYIGNSGPTIPSPTVKAPIPTAIAPTPKVKAPMMLSPVAVPIPQPTNRPVGNILHRINCGQNTKITVPPNNIVWNPDQYATNGLSFSTCSTADVENIYCTSHYFSVGKNAKPYRYDVPVPTSNRFYEVRLHFAEQYFRQINKRVFDVFLEGSLVIDNLDIYQRAGGVNLPYVFTTRPFVTDGSITIEFNNILENPQINGIEVFAVSETESKPTIAPKSKNPIAVPVVSSPSKQPIKPPPTGNFQDILINCGGVSYLENSGLRTWSPDKFFIGGSTYSLTSVSVENTVDDTIYQSERLGIFSYSIPVPDGTYEVSLHLAEIALTTENRRVFNMTVEKQAFNLIDIVKVAGGAMRAVTLDATVPVDDGFLTISVQNVKSDPKINGIEVKRSVPHIAHAVSNGPYRAVDNNNDGFATVFVDSSESHTHGVDLSLNSWMCKRGSQTIGTGEVTSFLLPVGTHNIALTVTDTGNNVATESTTVTVHPFGFPDIVAIGPSSGSTLGGERIFLVGSGFKYAATRTTVHFGGSKLTGTDIIIHNTTTISVLSPRIPINIPVLVSVETPLAQSDAKTFTYVSSTPIVFNSTKLIDFAQPTSVEFGPDGKLYVGSIKGNLARLTLDTDYTTVVSIVSSVVQPNRAILGITFDPLDAGNPTPPVYISSSLLFQGEPFSSSGTAINGKISRIRGANLDVIEDVIAGLPVCDLDHAVNQITFGNSGNLFVGIGSNTNGGEPGRISGSGRMKENYFSASIIEARLSDPAFDGFIEYDAVDDGSPINYNGITVFAPGLRNPFGITLHSNGNLYGTDNGPNTGYGKMRVGCDASDLLADQQREDKLVHLIRNKYYGHPNPKRASRDNDRRQCVWRNPTEPTSPNVQAPLGLILSSATGIIEYKADHFNGQLRHNLIHVKYRKELLRTVLSADGLSANPLSIPGIPLVGRDGLAVTQAPNGNLIEARYERSTIYVNIPIEAPTTVLKVHAVFPTRGGKAGGTIVSIYGRNFGTNPVITVGGSNCPLVGTFTPRKLRCTLPGGNDLVDITVKSGIGVYTFKKGYRYIAGV